MSRDGSDSLEAVSDAELVERARHDAEAFGQLYERHVDRIYRYVYQRTGNRADAEDLTARMFQQALTHLPRYRATVAPFGAWLFRIAHNLVANWHRDARRHAQITDGEVEMSTNSSTDPTAALDTSERRAELLGAVATLSTDRQHLIALRFVEELSIAEIATRLGRSEGAVKALLFRTLEELHRKLRESNEGPRSRRAAR